MFCAPGDGAIAEAIVVCLIDRLLCCCGLGCAIFNRFYDLSLSFFSIMQFKITILFLGECIVVIAHKNVR